MIKNKKRMLSLKTKAEVILIAALFIGIGINSVLGTVTITDTSLSDDTHGTIIDFTNNWMDITNISIGGMEINGSYNEYDTYIHNSKGNYFPFTFDGLQNATYDLNSTNGGWVELPAGILMMENGTTWSVPYMLTSNTWLRGAGNSTILRLGVGLFTDVIRSANCNHGFFEPSTNIAFGSYHGDYEMYNVKISDLVVDANDANQNWDITNEHGNYYMRNIFMVDVNGFTVENCLITNSSGVALSTKFCKDIVVENCVFSHLGLRLRNSSAVTNVKPHGIWMHTDESAIIKGNTMYDCYNGGIAIEHATTMEQTTDVIIDGNIMYDSFSGIWIENGRNVTVSNNIIYDLHGWYEQYNASPYTDAECTGILISHQAEDIVVTGNLIRNISYFERSNLSNASSPYVWKGVGISFGNINVTSGVISGNQITGMGRYGINSNAESIVISDNNIQNISRSYGICIQNDKPNPLAVISNNIVNDTGGTSIFITDRVTGLGNGCAIVSGNIISNSMDRGIESNWYNTSITGNIITKPASYGISLNLENSGICILKINDNTILELSGSIDGIYVRNCENGTVNDNMVVGDTKGGGGTVDGIQLQDSHNITVADNRVKDCRYGIFESDYAGGTDCGYNYITDNNVRGNTNGIISKIDSTTVSACNGSIIKDNPGYNYNSLFPYYKQATPPTMLQNTTAYWYNTTSTYSYKVFNFYGVQTYLNLSSTTY